MFVHVIAIIAVEVRPLVTRWRQELNTRGTRKACETRNQSKLRKIRRPIKSDGRSFRLKALES